MVEVPSLNMNDQEEEEEDRSWEEVKRPLKPRAFDATKSSIEVKRRTWEVIIPTDATMTESIKKLKKRIKKEKKERKEKEEQENLRQWDALPSTALLNIFCKSKLKDRLQSIPLVCKSWKSVTDDPRCWSSMIPDSVSLEDAFIKKISTIGYNVFDSYSLRLLEKEQSMKEFKEEEEQVTVGVSRLQTLIKKSGGGAAITTLYISAFVSSFPNEEESEKIRRAIRVIQLIANSCANLKHISFNRYYDSDPTYAEALLQLFKRCKKLELVDLSYFGNGADPLFIQELGSCLPNLRGIRIQGYEHILPSIAEYLPQLKLLYLHDYSYSLDAEHLSMTLFSSLEFQYLYVGTYQEPDFDYYYYYEGLNACSSYCCSWCDGTYFSKYKYLYETEDNFYIDDYHDILKQRKEDQYVSILKEKKEYHHTLKKKKKKEDQCNSSLKKKKKKKHQYDSSLKKKKKDQCNYADFVIQ